MRTTLHRRRFLKNSVFAGTGLLTLSLRSHADPNLTLPVGAGPAALDTPHFASRMQAFVWRNWQLAPLDRLATTVEASPEDLRNLGRSMGLNDPPPISEEIRHRAFITVIRRNWHLLPYDQLLTLLGWNEEQLAFALREDDFLFVKLGSLKPQCPPLRWAPPTDTERARASAIATIVRREFGDRPLHGGEPLFSFIRDLAQPPLNPSSTKPPATSPSAPPRFCYSYFALYGDALLDPQLDPYPDGYLARLAASGVTGVWLQALLATLSPFPWDPKVSEHYQDRRRQLRALVDRAARYGIRVYLYLNEPRARPLSFYHQHPELRGVAEADYAALCTSNPEVQDYLTNSLASLCQAVPNIGGFFTISASENLTHCWSHHQGKSCPRCGSRPPADVVAELHHVLLQGIRQAETKTHLIAWDWGWPDAWSAEVVERLPDGVALMSVSEWDVAIERGGITSHVGEYSLSTLGPGPRARRHWAAARKRGLPIFAKIQAGNTWELASVPYIPAVAQAWQHGRNLRQEHISGLMLGWTLGGHPSPNLEAAVAGLDGLDLESVARRRHGDHLALSAAEAWKSFSLAFREFPFHGGCVYHAPWQMGPANLLWPTPTGYTSTMVGLPYDDLTRWRAVYPPDTWCNQLEKVADGFDRTIAILRNTLRDTPPPPALAEEIRFAEACAIHWRSAANQARWILRRDRADTHSPEAQHLLHAEITLALRLHSLQSTDSRLGFEASNHYFYVPLDLVEKVLNCHWLLENSAA